MDEPIIRKDYRRDYRFVIEMRCIPIAKRHWYSFKVYTEWRFYSEHALESVRDTVYESLLREQHAWCRYRRVNYIGPKREKSSRFPILVLPRSR